MRDTQIDRVAEICDYIQLMTYDLRSGFCGTAGHHTAPYPSEGDDSELDTFSVVKMFMEAGVPANRLVTGAAFYSRKWTGVPDTEHGLFQTAGSLGLYGPGYTELREKFIGKQGFVRYWDEAAQAPWLFDGSTLISYDDPDSIRAKCRMIEEMGLLGIMYWEHGCDPSRELLRALSDTGL